MTVKILYSSSKFYVLISMSCLIFLFLTVKKLFNQTQFCFFLSLPYVIRYTHEPQEMKTGCPLLIIKGSSLVKINLLKTLNYILSSRT